MVRTTQARRTRTKRANTTRAMREKRVVASIIDGDESGIVTAVPSSPYQSPGRKSKMILSEIIEESPRKKAYITRSISYDDSSNNDASDSNSIGTEEDADDNVSRYTSINIGTPTKRRGINDLRSRIVTPSTTETNIESPFTGKGSGASTVRRTLEMPPIDESPTVIVEVDEESPDNEKDHSLRTKVKKRQAFGRADGINTISTQANTRKVYAIVNKLTGKIGGNGHGGAIYGELTIGSMQKMINLMKIHTGFDEKSRFIDVGSGLGKPNLHVAQDPCVEFSYGIEMEHVRWILSMSNLNHVLEEAVVTQSQELDVKEEEIQHRCTFQHGDITDAKTFDPFTHVYMFDIGFPPTLFKKLAEMFNTSQSEYLICYHAPYLIKDRYGFNVELIIQSTTSMHGSSENHMGYIYRRSSAKPKKSKSTVTVKHDDIPQGIPCDPLFVKAWMSTRNNASDLFEEVHQDLENNLSSQRPRRIRKPINRLTQ